MHIQRQKLAMRIALLSDIHGNCFALDAVLADIDAQGGVDEYWVLGDLVAVGAQPIDVLARLSALPNVRFTRGNTDRYIILGDRPRPHADDVAADFNKFPIYTEVAQTMAWTQGAVSSAGWMPFLDRLPLEQRATLPDGTRLLGVHGSPGEDGGRGLRPDYGEDEIRQRFLGHDADLICVGHTHWPMNRHVKDTHLVNLGSISNHQVPNLDAWYVMLQADTSGYQVEHRQVDYDREAVIAKLEELRHPARDYIIGIMRGSHIRDWPLPDAKP